MALTPEGLVVAGASGAATAGVPGAIAAVALTVLQSFNRTKAPDRFAGTPKEPLEIPFWNVMRQFIGDLGRLSVERDASGSTLTDVQKKMIPRRGGLIVAQIFERATVAEIRALLDLPSETVLGIRGSLEGSTFLDTGMKEGDVVVMNPVTGIEQPPERVDRGRYNEGLGNEFVSQPQSKALAPSIVPVIELGRYIQAERVQGNQIQRRYSVFAGIMILTDILRIVGKPDKQIYIRSVNVSVVPNLTSATPEYEIRAFSTAPSVSTIQIGHYRYIRNDPALTRDGATVEAIAPAFTVPNGQDYVNTLEIFNIQNLAVRISIDASYIPIGVNGSQC